VLHTLRHRVVAFLISTPLLFAPDFHISSLEQLPFLLLTFLTNNCFFVSTAVFLFPLSPMHDLLRSPFPSTMSSGRLRCLPFHSRLPAAESLFFKNTARQASYFPPTLSPLLNKLFQLPLLALVKRGEFVMPPSGLPPQASTAPFFFCCFLMVVFFSNSLRPSPLPGGPGFDF